MTSRLATTLSVVFHPFLITLYSFALVFVSGSYIAYLPSFVKLIVLTVVLLNTILIPMVSLLILRRMGLIKSFGLEKHRERILPLIITAIPYIFTLYLMGQLPVPRVLLRIIGSGVAVLLVATLISYWWKISLHLMGMGALSGFLLAYALQTPFNALPWLTATFGVAGLLASARLKGGNHNPAQVYAGYLAGLAIVFTTFLV